MPARRVTDQAPQLAAVLAPQSRPPFGQAPLSLGHRVKASLVPHKTPPSAALPACCIRLDMGRVEGTKLWESPPPHLGIPAEPPPPVRLSSFGCPPLSDCKVDCLW